MSVDDRSRIGLFVTPVDSFSFVTLLVSYMKLIVPLFLKAGDNFFFFKFFLSKVRSWIFQGRNIALKIGLVE